MTIDAMLVPELCCFAAAASSLSQNTRPESRRGVRSRVQTKGTRGFASAGAMPQREGQDTQNPNPNPWFR